MATESEPRSETGSGPISGYAAPAQRPPLAPYAAFALVFNAALAGFVAGGRKGRWTFPERIGPGDVVLVAAASHKLGRVIAKAKVTSFLRAPFKRYEGGAGPAEVDEQTRGTGIRAAFGDLIGCPWCLSLWFSGGLTAGLVAAPRETRFVATIFTAEALADFLNVAYKAMETRGLED